MRLIYCLSILLIVFSPLYRQANLGGTGFDLTYNIPIWTSAILLISTLLFQCVNNKRWYYPKHWLLILSFPIAVIVSSLFASPAHTEAWLFRQLYILGGFVLLFGLFQLRLTAKQQERILYLIIISVSLQASIGIAQIHIADLAFFSTLGHVPRGNFQQINVQVSFQVTGLLVCLFLVSRPSFKQHHIYSKALIAIGFASMLYIIIASGSRTALLSLVLGLPCIFMARYHFLLKQKQFLLILLSISVFAVILANSNVTTSGINKTIDKFEQLKEQQYTNARVAIYTIGIDLIKEKPISGHGIGNFLKTWNPAASEFVIQHPETVLPNTIHHPHNELLFWAIEGGLLVLSSLLIMTVTIISAIFRLGMRGTAYAALLLPITLHTQVELPFYISSLHWFIWLFLLYLLLNHDLRSKQLNLSIALQKTIKLVSVGIAIFSTLFLINTARAQKDIYNFVNGIQTSTPPLSIALNNLYTRNYAEQLAMRSMLYHSAQNKSNKQLDDFEQWTLAYKVEEFEQWALDYVEKSPELKMYEDLIEASIYLRPEGKGCDAIQAGYYMYAHNEALIKARNKCISEGLLSK